MSAAMARADALIAEYCRENPGDPWAKDWNAEQAKVKQGV